MSWFTLTDLAGCAACLVLAGVVLCANPRRGTSQVLAASLLITAAMALGMGFSELRHSSRAEFLFWTRWTFACLALLCPFWLIFATIFAREDWKEALRGRSWLLAAAFLTGGFFAAAPFAARDFFRLGPQGREEEFLLGTWGLLHHLYLLAASLAILATVETTFRAAQEYVRWRIKHLLLGLTLLFGLITFHAILVLVYRRTHFDLLRFSTIAICAACGCMAVSIHRHRTLDLGFSISHRLAYRSIVLIASGTYLIFMGIVVEWLGSATRSPYLAALAAFAAIIALSLLLLSSSFRARVRRLVLRNLFRSRYDYRDLWLRTVEASVPEPKAEEIGARLCALLRETLGGERATVWERRDVEGRPRLRLLASTGLFQSPPAAVEAGALVEEMEACPEPFEAQPFLQRVGSGPAGAAAHELFASTRAVLCAPLVSGKQVVGLITVGARAAGGPMDGEDLECLRVLAGHAAGQIHNAQLLERLVAAKEAEAFRTLSTFLIHDLKNFTSTLNLIAENASQHQGNPEFLRDAFQSVTRISQTMSRLCGSLRTLVGGLQAQPRTGDLEEMVRQVLDGFQVEEGGLVHFSPGGLPPLPFDDGLLRSVLMNLLLNSREALRPGGRIEISSRLESGWACLEVKDDGVGIPRRFLERELFVPFRTTKSGGTGIGLFQSKSIIEAHGGRISVESEEGRGTTVRVLLPIPAAPTASHAGPEPAAPAAGLVPADERPAAAARRTG